MSDGRPSVLSACTQGWPYELWGPMQTFLCAPPPPHWPGWGAMVRYSAMASLPTVSRRVEDFKPVGPKSRQEAIQRKCSAWQALLTVPWHASIFHTRMSVTKWGSGCGFMQSTHWPSVRVLQAQDPFQPNCSNCPKSYPVHIHGTIYSIGLHWPRAEVLCRGLFVILHS